MCLDLFDCFRICLNTFEYYWVCLGFKFVWTCLILCWSCWEIFEYCLIFFEHIRLFLSIVVFTLFEHGWVCIGVVRMSSNVFWCVCILCIFLSCLFKKKSLGHVWVRFEFVWMSSIALGYCWIRLNTLDYICFWICLNMFDYVLDMFGYIWLLCAFEYSWVWLFSDLVWTCLSTFWICLDMFLYVRIFLSMLVFFCSNMFE